MREKIRTPGLLIRSQTLYPAELRAQIISRTSHLCSVLEILYISFSKNASPFFNFFLFIFLTGLKQKDCHVTKNECCHDGTQDQHTVFLAENIQQDQVHPIDQRRDTESDPCRAAKLCPGTDIL